MRESGTHRRCRRGLAPWARFAAGALLLAAVVLGLMQGYTPPGIAGEVLRNNVREGIDATPLFYTESEASYEAELAVRDTLERLDERADHPAGSASVGTGEDLARSEPP
jgi:hypothetical protein